MSFDLTGLPPTELEVRRFAESVRENRAAAVLQLIERLLSSPRYGEFWGRHWLDVARYSDTKGYVYGREEPRFIHAPWYRAWVIRAFNHDLPYDRFLMLQLAADQVPSADPSDLPAMGFVTGGRRFLGVTHDIIDDRIDVVTRATLGLTVACARCHDHKYDPIPTRDYYSLYGVFHGADDAMVSLGKSDDKDLVEKQLKFREKLVQHLQTVNAALRAKIGDYLAVQLDLNKYPEEGFDELLTPGEVIPSSVRRWRDFLRTSESQTHPIFAPWNVLAPLKLFAEGEFSTAAAQALAPVLQQPRLNSWVRAQFSTPIRSAPEAARRYAAVFKEVEDAWNALVKDAAQKKLPAPQHLADPAAEELRQFLYDPQGPSVVPDTGMVNTEFFFPTPVCEELWKLQGEVDRRWIALGVPAARVLKDRQQEPNPRVFVRGRASRLGEEVPRQFIEVLSPSGREPFRYGSGRLELARAIVDPENPLTARVMVNRIWQHHFGSGLVKTPSDFGLRSEPPSHPALLDWLARRFIAEGWSVKAIHRLILGSSVYQQARPHSTSRGLTRTSTSDPENRMLAHASPRRLNFEQLRDSMLAVSGQLDLSMGTDSPPLLDAGNKRRTVYSFVDRQFLLGTFRTFDFANPDLHVAVRHETTVPQQALFYLNGKFAAQCARALMTRVAGEAAPERVQALHRLVYQRSATSQEAAAGLQFIRNAEVEQPEPADRSRGTAWRYGFGAVDTVAGRVQAFTPLPHFTGTAWQGAVAFPGGTSGWALLDGLGGHPGNTPSLACIRRWIAPIDATVKISGILKHDPAEGDGVRGWIISSRQGILKQATVHKGQADMAVAEVAVRAGDTIDFVVDIGGTLSHDQFLWAPLLTVGGDKWNAQSDFGGPGSGPSLLEPWAQYSQVLLLANEFSFLD